MATFGVPVVNANLTGWSPTTLPSQYASIPYSPFSKNVGVIRIGGGGGGSEGFEHVDHGRQGAVTMGNKRKPNWVPRPAPQFSMGGRPGQGQSSRSGGSRFGAQSSQQEKQGGGRSRDQPTSRTQKLIRNNRQASRRLEKRIERKFSVELKEKWEVVEEFDLVQLLKLQANEPPAENL